MMPRSESAPTSADSRSSRPIGWTGGGSSIVRYVLDELPALVVERGCRVVVEVEVDEVGKSEVLVAGLFEAVAGRARACASAPGGRRRARAPGGRASRGWCGSTARSGSFSMLAKRNASGHDVNDSTRLGDRLVGTSNTASSYDGGVTVDREPPVGA